MEEKKTFARVAQSGLEQVLCKHQVVGSNPISGSSEVSTILLNEIKEKIYDYRIISSTIGVTWNILMSRLRRVGRYIVELIYNGSSSYV